MQRIRPTEIYNLRPRTMTSVSAGIYRHASALGVLRLLERSGFSAWKETRFYQASTSELYGLVQEVRKRNRRSIRARLWRRKAVRHWIDEPRGLRHVRLSILFNHESPIRGETFVTRKIARRRPSRPDWKVRSISEISGRDATGAAGLCRGMHRMCELMRPTISCWRQARPVRCANSSSWRSRSRPHHRWRGKGVETGVDEIRQIAVRI